MLSQGNLEKLLLPHLHLLSADQIQDPGSKVLPFWLAPPAGQNEPHSLEKYCRFIPVVVSVVH